MTTTRPDYEEYIFKNPASLGDFADVGAMYATAEAWSVGAQIVGLLGVGCVATGALLERRRRGSGTGLLSFGLAQLTGAVLAGLESAELRKTADSLDELAHSFR